MKRLLAFAVVTATCLAAPALAQTMPPPAISVTGEANVSVPPDQAQIDGGVTSDAKTAREASDANNAAMGKVLLALKGAGIEEKDYQTSRLSLQPQFATSSKVPERAAGIVSFRASNRVTVRIRDVTKVANVIDVLAGAGANDIGGINFTVTQASRPAIPRQGGGTHGRRRAGRAGRRDPFGDGERVLGDQGRAVISLERHTPTSS